MLILIELLVFAMLSASIIVLCLMIEALCDLVSPWDAITHSGRHEVEPRLPFLILPRRPGRTHATGEPAELPPRA